MATQTMTMDANNQDGYKGSGSWFETNLSLIGSSGVIAYWRLKIATTIPQGSTINSANFLIRTANDVIANLDTDFKFENSSNPTTPDSAANLTGRTFTTAETNYVDTGQTTNEDKTFDVTSSLQEVVNARTLTAGEYVLLTNHWNSGGFYYQMTNRETSTVNCGRLEVDWTESTGNRRRRFLTAA